MLPITLIPHTNFTSLTAVDDGLTNSASAINSAMATLTSGQALHLKGEFRIDSTIDYPNVPGIGIYLEGKIFAGPTFVNKDIMINFYDYQRNQFVHGVAGNAEINGSDRQVMVISGKACKYPVISGLTIRQWKHGVSLKSAVDSALEYPLIEDCLIYNDNTITVAEYPIFISSTVNGWSVISPTIRNVEIRSPEGEHVREDLYATPPVLPNKYCADMIALQGCKNFLVDNCRLYGSGESGMGISRSSRNGIVRNTVMRRADANGAQVGSAAVEFYISASAASKWMQFADNNPPMLVRGKTSGQTGALLGIVDYGVDFASNGHFDRYLARVGTWNDPMHILPSRPLSAGFFTEIEWLTLDVPNIDTDINLGANTVFYYTQDIIFDNCVATNNGLNLTSGSRAGYILSRARNIKLSGVSGNALDYFTPTQYNHVYVNSSTYDATGLTPLSVTGDNIIHAGIGSGALGEIVYITKAMGVISSVGTLIGDGKNIISSTNTSAGRYTIVLDTAVVDYTDTIIRVDTVQTGCFGSASIASDGKTITVWTYGVAGTVTDSMANPMTTSNSLINKKFSIEVLSPITIT